MDKLETKKANKNKIILAAIMILAFGLRGILITQSPPSLYWEEAALGYDAYSILKTGKDYHGNAWPLVAFESFGDWKPSGYFYALVPFLVLFGSQDWTVRLPAVLAGTLTVLLVYLIGRQLDRGKAWALWSALMLAILPWHIQFSRAAFEVTLATFYLTLGLYWLVLAKKKPVYLILACIVMAMSMYTYHGLRVLAPLMALSLFIINWGSYRKTNYWWISVILAVCLTLPILKAWQSPQIQQRINETSLFSTSQAVLETNKYREADGNTLLSRIIHHRYWYWGGEIFQGSMSHFNPKFLFVSGDTNARHQTGILALLYPWMAIPLIIGIIGLLSKKQDRNAWLLLWIYLATIPPALTNTAPHTLRFLPAAPAFALIIGLGMEKIEGKIKEQRMAKSFGFAQDKWLYGAMAIIIAGSVMIYAYDLWWVYPKRSSRDWQYGYKQVIQSIKGYYDAGIPIYFTREYGRPSIYALWYLQIDPRLVQQQEPGLPKDQGELLALDSIYFDGRNPSRGGIVVSPKPDPALQPLVTVNFLDGKTAFWVGRYE